MTLHQKIGQMLVFGWTGDTREEETTVNDHAREIVQEMEVGGVVLLGRNVADDLAVTAATLSELQALSREPLFVIADQEGGMVARFVDGVTVFPSNMALGATRDASLAYKAAAITAEELLAIGVNYNFAPCVDVNNNPNNPIIGTRSYGESPELCAQFAEQAVRGYQEHGMIACAKHFPGHGDTAADSHLILPVIPHDQERLNAVELVPFKAAIKAGIGSVMTTHILFPALDPNRPSTLSPRIVSGLLRDELGFDGVVVTDCMEMKAIADNWGTPEAAVMAIEAGVDLVLVCHTRSTQQETREAILKAVIDGRIPESRLDESIRRIRALKERFRLNERRQTGESVARFAMRNLVEDKRRHYLLSVLRDPDHLAVQREIAERSVTVVRDDGAIPVSPDLRILVVGLHSTVEPLAEAIRGYTDKVECIKLENQEIEAGLTRALEVAESADVLVIPVCNPEPWREPVDQESQVRLVRKLAAYHNGRDIAGYAIVLVAVREPYILGRFTGIGTQICTYGYREGMLEAAAAVMFGRIKPTGVLPVSIPEIVDASIRQTPLDEIEQYF